MRPTVLAAIEPVMNAAIGPVAARGVYRTLPPSVNARPGSLDVVEVRELLAQLETGGRLFSTTGAPVPARSLLEAITGGAPARAKELQLPVVTDHDVREVERATLALIRGFFGITECVRLGAAVAELARNIVKHAGEGTVSVRVSDESEAWFFEVEAVDRGPGIAGLDAHLKRPVTPSTASGLHWVKARLDSLHVDTALGHGTRIHGVKKARKG